MRIPLPGRAARPVGAGGVACIAICAVAALPSCGGSRTRTGTDSVPSQSIEEVLAAHTDSLMALPGVVGTAIGMCGGTPCIRVFLADSRAARRAQIPRTLDGYRVATEVTGAYRARPDPGAH